MEEKLSQKKENFLKASHNLQEAYSSHYPSNEEYDQVALIAFFNLALEMALQYLKEKLKSKGIRKSRLKYSKSVFEIAFENGFIPDIQTWLYAVEIKDQLKEANNLDALKKYVKLINDQFLPQFENLVKQI